MLKAEYPLPGSGEFDISNHRRSIDTLIRPIYNSLVHGINLRTDSG